MLNDFLKSRMDPAAKRFKAAEEDRFSPSVSSVPSDIGGLQSNHIFEKFLALENQLNCQLNTLSFPRKVSVIYKPLEYAYETHSYFVRKYLTTVKDVLFVGMNPGPFGMVQTGIPFGEVSLVRDWLMIQGNVGKPTVEHPKRKVLGFECTRKEVSGQRFWNFFKDLCHTPDQFFRYSFVHNYCPLVYMAETGKNITPSSLLCDDRKALQEMCDKHICDAIRLLQVKVVIAVGKYTYERIKHALNYDNICNVRVESIMHPSPRNPEANQRWKCSVMQKLQDLDMLHYFTPP